MAQTTTIFQAPTSNSGGCYRYGHTCGCNNWCDGCKHAGIDYCGADTDDIVAIGSGRVCYVSHSTGNRGLGKTVIIAHKQLDGTNIYSLYAHLKSIDPSIIDGMYLTKGFYIGEKGKTGAGANNIVHLHFEMKNHCGLGHSNNCTGAGCVAYVKPGRTLTEQGYLNPGDYINSTTNKYKDIRLNATLPATIKKSNATINVDVYSPFTEESKIDVRLVLYNLNGSERGTIKQRSNYNMPSGFSKITFSNYSLSSAEGTYKMGIQYKVPNSTKWILMPTKHGVSNIRQVQLEATVSKPDIYLRNQKLNITNVYRGQQIKASCNQYLSGESPRVFPDVGYYYSRDNKLDSGDRLITSDQSSIGGGDVQDPESAYFKIPANAKLGTGYILFVADFRNEVVESNENNNIRAVKINVSANDKPDIYVSSVGLDDVTVYRGQEVKARCRQNARNASERLYPNVGYYYSRNPSLDRWDILLDSDWSSIGGGDPYDAESERFNIPTNAKIGTGYILFVADHEDEVVESNESNNVRSVKITVTSSALVGENVTSSRSSNTTIPAHLSTTLLYPNPTSNVSMLEFEVAQISEVELYLFNANGQVLRKIGQFDKVQGKFKQELDFSDLANGTYFIGIAINGIESFKKVQIVGK